MTHALATPLSRSNAATQATACGSDCWNEHHRVRALFAAYPAATHYLGTEYVGTGLWADVVARMRDGVVRVLRVH